ncbi:hypothetical protein [Bacillus sp. JCM 19041]|uniref:hypothetical protein n=1 Tax=Bacillus sp. JCM 19041 TaxID=1460637 RepID=UPI0006D2CB1E
MLFFSKKTEAIIRYAFLAIFFVFLIGSIALSKENVTDQIILYGIAGISAIGIITGINRIQVERKSAIFEIGFCTLALILIFFVF